MCLDAFNCKTAAGTPVGIFPCHPDGTRDCGYKNQQWKAPANRPSIINVNSGTCLTWVNSTAVVIAPCTPGAKDQRFSASEQPATELDYGHCFDAVYRQ